MTSEYTVKTTAELNSLTRDFRQLGYNIIAFCQDFRELEKGDHIVVIERQKRQRTNKK